MLSSKEENLPFIYFTLYIVTAFVITILSMLLLYVACSRKYRLNWYEKNLLESVIKSKINSETSSIQSFYPSMEDNSVNEHNTIITNAPLIGTENAPITLEEEILSSRQVMNNYSIYSHASLTDTSSSSQAVSNEKAFIFQTPTKLRQITSQSKLDPTKINKSFYQETTKIDNILQSSNIPTGIIHLILLYDITAGILTVKIIEAHHLCATELNGTANPYAKIRLLPHHSNVWQTRVHKKTLNPVFDEDFVFEVSPQEVQEHIVEVILCDFIAYSRHRNIGNLRLPLKMLDLHQQVSIWKELKPYPEQDKKAELGDLLISLAYLPSAERLTVTVIKARNLKIVDESRTSSDPFIKVSLISNGKRIKKQKTSFHRNTISPLFNEALSFNVCREVLKHCCIEFKVLHDNLLGNNELLGCCVIGGDVKYCRSNERKIFTQLLHDQNVPPQWLPLIDTSFY